MIKRRTLLMALAAWAGVARDAAVSAQQRKVWLVGFLALPARPDRLEGSRFGEFVRGMRELGYAEGENLKIEWRFADGDVTRLSKLASELVDLKVDVIVGGATPVIGAAQKATSTIPIVMAPTNDPVGTGLVKTLARPGGNITGLSNLSTDLSPKMIELLRAMVPGAVRVGILSNPQNPSNAAILDKLRAAMATVGMTGIDAEAEAAEKVGMAFATMLDRGAQAVIVAPDTLFVEQRRHIAELALTRRLATICEFREHVEAGALISYGQNLADGYRRTATFVHRIFKGGRPNELPIEQSTKLELVINRATARALGIEIPAELLARADEVVE